MYVKIPSRALTELEMGSLQVVTWVGVDFDLWVVYQVWSGFAEALVEDSG